MHTDVLQGFFHYTLLAGRLVGSEHPETRGRPRAVLAAMAERFGVGAMLTLTPQFATYDVPGLEQHHVPIAAIPTADDAARACALIDRCASRGQAVWVHCQRGVDRTGCVLGCYLTSHGHAPDRVIAELRRYHPPLWRHPRLTAAWAPYERLIRSFSRVTTS